MPPEALTGFMHGHKTRYLLALLPAIQVILVLAGGDEEARFAKAVRLMAKWATVRLGGLSCLWGSCCGIPRLATGFIWLAILLWGLMEVASKRLVVPQCDAVLAVRARIRCPGSLIHLGCLVAIVGLMTVKPF